MFYQNSYFGFGSILKPKMADTFGPIWLLEGEEEKSVLGQISKQAEFKKCMSDQAVFLPKWFSHGGIIFDLAKISIHSMDIFYFIKGPLKPNFRPNIKDFWISVADLCWILSFWSQKNYISQRSGKKLIFFWKKKVSALIKGDFWAPYCGLIWINSNSQH